MRSEHQTCNQVNKFKLFAAALFLIFGGACASKQVGGDPNAIDISSQKKVAEEFEKGNILMDSEDFKGALKVFDRIIVDNPVSTLDAMVMFNSGLSHMMIQECAPAENLLRKVVRFTNVKTPALAIRAKLKLSDALACQGKQKEAMVLLLEIYRDRKMLPLEIGEAEVPAKIAAGYSRIGNRKYADRYFKIAELGVRKIEATRGSEQARRMTLARTLFMMGDTSFTNEAMQTPEAYFLTLKTQQKYLLKTIEYDVKPWSAKASDQILAAYDKTWDILKNQNVDEKTDDPKLRREQKVQKSKILQMALSSIRDLRHQRNLGITTSSISTQLLEAIEKRETKISNFLVSEAPGSEQTAEAMKLDSPRREGRVKSDTTVLERKAKAKKK